MLRRTGVLWAAASAATALAWGLTATGAAADGAIGCGSAITEDTVLTQDLLDCEDGLTIAAPDVTLDLGGHQIGGPRRRLAGCAIEAQTAVVRNGSITELQLRGVQFRPGKLGGDGSRISTFRQTDPVSMLGSYSARPDLRVENSTIQGHTGDGAVR